MKAVAAFAAAGALAMAGFAAPAMAATPPPLKPLHCSPKTIDRLQYNGGGDVYRPEAVLIFWGKYWKTDKAKPVIAELKKLFKGLGSSHYAETLTQYCDLSQPHNISHPDIRGWLLSTAGPYFDSATPPKHPSDQDFANQIYKVARWDEYGDPIPVVLTPPGVAPAADVKNGSCGHHAIRDVPDGPSSPPRTYAWADVPWGLIKANPTGMCQPKGNAGYGLSVVAVHEWSEVTTDPFNGYPNPHPGIIVPAWGTKHDGEIADMCEGKNPKLIDLNFGAGKFMLPALWSNNAGPGKGECVWSS